MQQSELQSYHSGHLMRLVLPFVSDELVNQATAQHLVKQAEGLPHAVEGAFEAWLGQDVQRVDFSILAFNHTEEHALLDAYVRQRAQAEGGAWKRLATLFQDPAYRSTKQLWLEYDLDKSGQPPGIFIGVPQDTPLSIETVEHILFCLFERNAIPAALLENLARCFEALPASASMHTLGHFLGRKLTAVRVPPYNLSPAEIEQLLTRLDYGGDPAQVRELAERYRPYADYLEVDLDVGDRLYPRTGIHLYIADQPRVNGRWADLLNRLVTDGLCTPAEHDALLAYPGVQNPFADPGQSPPYLRWQQVFSRPTERCRLVRALSHVKLVYEPGQPLYAKVYFYYLVVWMPE